MKIFLWPSPTLKKVSEPIDIASIQDGSFRYDSKSLDEIVAEMEKLMWLNKGLGLSAIQVGMPIRLVCTLLRDVRVMINPTITETIGLKSEVQEGCLSLPGITAIVDRYFSVNVKYWDENGEEQNKMLDNVSAQCIQHELEHLDGHFFTESMTRGNQQLVFGEINKLRKMGLWKTKII